MSNKLELYNLKEELTTSQVFGLQYSDALENVGGAFDSIIYQDVEDMYNNIVGGDFQISDFQETVLQNLFREFDYIREVIDPERIKPFQHFYNADDELVLWRRDEQKLINLIIHEESDIVLSYIEEQGESKLTFHTIEDDLQSVALRFLS